MRPPITEEFLKTITKKDVLALDIASRTGYYSYWEYGTWHFYDTEKAPKKLGLDYDQHKCFRDTLKKFIEEHHIKVIAAEDVNVGTRFVAVRRLSEFRGILLELTAELHIPVIFFNVTSIKRWATGNGNADKKLMMEYAVKRWKIDPEGDDNVGDATHIYFYFTHRYHLN